MNMDLYDLNVVAAATAEGTQPDESSSSLSSSSSTNNANTPTASLNEEVTQMFSQLGRFWGGVRKQSQTVFESARKDLGEVVSQAQKELEKTFNPSTATSASATIPTTSEATPSDRSTEKTAASAEDEEVVQEEATKANPQSESNANTTPSPSTSTSPSSSATTFFSRLQSSLPPNITPSSLSSTFQRHLPLENIQHQLQHNFNLERATADFAQLRATLADNIQRVQSDTTVQQAEKLAEQYLQKGEAFFKEAGEFFKDAVKVLPPEGEDAPSGVMWDGTDVWSVPSTIITTPTTGTTPPPSSRKGKEKEDTTPSAPRLLGKRKEILLRKLHSNPDEIRRNPEEETDVNVKEMWLSFTKEVEDNGTIQGKVWKDKVDAVITRSNDEDTLALLKIHKQLVPSELSDEAFWTRYFFRIAQIEREEERRKALLEGTNKQDDDQDDEFTWEDDEEEDKQEDKRGEKEEEQGNATMGSIEGAATLASASEITSSVPTLVPSPSPKAASTTQTPSVSPRRSEDSYDVVSSNVSSTGQKSPETKRDGDNDEDDSDWE